MNIWLLMTGEPLEFFGERPHRVGILSKILVKQNHNVTWWTTTFDHQHKKYLYKKNIELKNDLGVDMVFLHSKTNYKKNISLNRIKNHREVGAEFKSLAINKTKPDIIFCAFPTIDLANEAVNFGLLNKIPVVIDVRDLWPDTFKHYIPPILMPLASLVLSNMYRKTNNIFKKAYAITGITDEFVNYGIRFSNRTRTELDKSFSFGYPIPSISKVDKDIAFNKLKKEIDFNKFVVCFFGTIDKSFDFDTVIEAAKKLNNNDIIFVICGKGGSLLNLKEQTKDMNNIVFPGWINNNEILTMMDYSNAALSPYINTKDYLTSISNKSIEYLAGSLPVLSSIRGVFGNILIENDCGLVYDNCPLKLLENILLLKNNKDLHKQMALNAKKLYENNYSDIVVYPKMINHFEKILNHFNS